MKIQRVDIVSSQLYHLQLAFNLLFDDHSGFVGYKNIKNEMLILYSSQSPNSVKMRKFKHAKSKIEALDFTWKWLIKAKFPKESEYIGDMKKRGFRIREQAYKKYNDGDTSLNCLQNEQYGYDFTVIAAIEPILIDVEQ